MSRFNVSPYTRVHAGFATQDIGINVSLSIIKRKLYDHNLREQNAPQKQKIVVHKNTQKKQCSSGTKLCILIKQKSTFINVMKRGRFGGKMEQLIKQGIQTKILKIIILLDLDLLQLPNPQTCPLKELLSPSNSYDMYTKLKHRILM